MTHRNRQRWTAEEKLGILEEARQTPQTISEVCRRHGIAPGQFYREAQLQVEVARLRAVVAEPSA